MAKGSIPKPRPVTGKGNFCTLCVKHSFPGSMERGQVAGEGQADPAPSFHLASQVLGAYQLCE